MVRKCHFSLFELLIALIVIWYENKYEAILGRKDKKDSTRTTSHKSFPPALLGIYVR